MYTVKELIEALQQCPENYTIFLDDHTYIRSLEAVTIFHEGTTVFLTERGETK